MKGGSGGSAGKAALSLVFYKKMDFYFILLYIFAGFDQENKQWHARPVEKQVKNLSLSRSNLWLLHRATQEAKDTERVLEQPFNVNPA